MQDNLPELPSIRPAECFSWESQARQYAVIGKPGISQEDHEILSKPVHCLLFRDANGRLRGVLNYYPQQITSHSGPRNRLRTGTARVIQEAQSCNIWVSPKHRRQGIATRLLRTAIARWPIPLASQRYTPDGLAFVRAFVQGALQRALNRESVVSER
jgi:GNAT superfamily N-acetyltransferase